MNIGNAVSLPQVTVPSGFLDRQIDKRLKETLNKGKMSCYEMANALPDSDSQFLGRRSCRQAEAKTLQSIDQLKSGGTNLFTRFMSGEELTKQCFNAPKALAASLAVKPEQVISAKTASLVSSIGVSPIKRAVYPLPGESLNDAWKKNTLAIGEAATEWQAIGKRFLPENGPLEPSHACAVQVSLAELKGVKAINAAFVEKMPSITVDEIGQEALRDIGAAGKKHCLKSSNIPLHYAAD